jgi:integrase
MIYLACALLMSIPAGSEVLKGAWIAPESGEVELGEYAVKWISERKLAPRTREGYEDYYRLHIKPLLGALMIGSIHPATIRGWRKRLLDAGVKEPQVVKAYCLLRAIFNTAIRDDGLIRENPCRIKGYDTYNTPERPVGSVEEVFRLADEVPDRFRALIMLAALSGLRWGELAALRRRDLDLDAAVVRVPRKQAALRNGLEFGPPKSAAGNRTVALPAAAVDALALHLRDYVKVGREALLFTGERAECSVRPISNAPLGGCRRLTAPAYPRASTSTTSGTPETTSLRRPARAPGS